MMIAALVLVARGASAFAPTTTTVAATVHHHRPRRRGSRRHSAPTISERGGSVASSTATAATTATSTTNGRKIKGQQRRKSPPSSTATAATATTTATAKAAAAKKAARRGPTPKGGRKGTTGGGANNDSGNRRRGPSHANGGRAESRTLERDPWDADYASSLETQRRIKLSAETRSSPPSSSPSARANSVLRAFLDADPRECNAANVVCALTLSSKLLGRRGGRGSDRGGGRWDYDDDEEEGEYEVSMWRMVSILVAHFASRPGGLSPWQLCNAA